MPEFIFVIELVLIFLLTGFCILFYLKTRRAIKAETSSSNFKNVFESIWRIEKAVLETVDFNEATTKVVNIILTELGYINYGYEVIVLTLLDKEKNGLRRIAISRTEAADKFLQATPIPFEDIIIPLSATDNLSIKAINENKKFTTETVADVLYPAINREWVEGFQEALGIKTSIAYPIVAKEKILGSLILSLSKEEKMISDQEWAILDSFIGAVGIALDNALLFRSLNDTTLQLKDANERLQELDKLKDEFVSLASHELRTPMTVIKSYVWMLLQNKAGEINDKQKIYLDRTYSSTERLINLVNDMLNISRIESGRLVVNMKEVDMAKLTSDVVTEMQTKAQELGVNLLYASPSSMLMVKADDERIKQVIINLLGNSFKFTPKGGNITVTLSSDGNLVTLKVADNGKGISVEDIPKLFKKFNMVGTNYLTKLNTQGTGLGLYLSKSLIEMHGGKIWAESPGEGHGSTFAFTLPVLGSQMVQGQQVGQNLSLGQVQKQATQTEPVEQVQPGVVSLESQKPEVQTSLSQQDNSLPH